RRRHTRFSRDWSSDVCSSDLKNYNLRPAPPGKFEGGYVIDEAVYELLLDGPDEEVGDLFGEGVWYSLLESLDGLDTSGFTEDERSEERRAGTEGSCRERTDND